MTRIQNKMPAYRCYLLSSSGAIVSAEVIECGDDAEAATRGHDILVERPTFHGVEIWDRDRRIHKETRG